MDQITKKTKVAVAGGFGFLGTNIVKILSKKGYDVVPFSRKSGVDILKFDQLSAFLTENNPEIMINCAAHVGGISYNSLKPVEVYEDNLIIGFNLIKASFEAEVKKFVNIMPNCTYPGIAEIYSEPAWWNGEMHDTVLTYGMPRKALWVHAWALNKKYGFKSIHLVLPNLYGPLDHFDPVRSHALGALIKKIVDAKQQGNRTIEIWGTGSPIREWGYVEDAAEGVVLAMEKYDDIGIMNIGQGKGYTVSEIAYLIKDAVNWRGEFVFNPSKPDGAPKKILDVSKMNSILGWSPETELKDGIKKTLAWYMEHGNANH